jgi:hypothetical protein
MRFRAFIYFLILSSLLFSTPSLSTEPVIQGPKDFKHQFFVYWGYNRAWYSTSDIHFQGTDYDFTLSSVTAHDKQTPVGADPYLQPDKLTIPQTNLRIGYFFREHWSISIGDDHMKYVMTQDQVVEINGFIQNTSTEYNDVYHQQSIQLKDDFLKFEHTDGLNYINVELRRMDNLLRLGKYQIANIDINLTEGFGAGMLFPRTNTTLLGQETHDEFHVSGYGFSGMAGVNIMFWDHVFLQSEFKAGYINMPDILTTYSSSDKASQHFFFTQVNFLLGAQFRLFKTKAEKKPE